MMVTVIIIISSSVIMVVIIMMVIVVVDDTREKRRRTAITPSRARDRDPQGRDPFLGARGEAYWESLIQVKAT
jgi:hypothetical protein